MDRFSPLPSASGINKAATLSTVDDETAVCFLFRPSPYAIGLSALISLHNHVEGTTTTTLEYQEKEADQVDSFLQDVLFFPKNNISKEQYRLSHLIQDLSLHMGPSCTIPQQMLEWFAIAVESLDAFIDFVTTSSSSPAGSNAASATNPSAADLWQRSVGQAWEDMSFVMTAKLYKEFQRQLDQAKAALESGFPPPPAKESPELSSSCPASFLLMDQVGTRSTDLSSAAHSWQTFVQHLENNERVGATAAMHQYIDYHGDDALGTAGFLQVGLAHHFGASTVLARNEAERVVQQHGGSTVLPVVENLTHGTTAAATVIDDFSDMILPDDATRAERLAALSNRALSVLKGPTGIHGSPSKNLYTKAIGILLEEDPSLDDTAEVAYYLLHEWAVRRCDAPAAEAWMASLQDHDKQHDPNYISQKALYLSHNQGNWEAAAKLLQPHRQTLLLQLAETYVYARQYTAALPPLLEHCAQHKNNAAGIILLATVHLEYFRDTLRAGQLVRAALPVALQKEHVFWQAQAYWVLARCGGGSVESALERSRELFELLDDVSRLRDVHYYAARYYNDQEQFAKRNKSAEEFVKLNRKPETQLPLPRKSELIEMIKMTA